MPVPELPVRPNLTWRGPWLWLAIGGGCQLLILAWSLALSWLGIGDVSEARVALLVLGLLAAAVGVVKQPGSPFVLSSAGLVGLLSWLPIAQWDSALQLMVFLTGVAFLAAILMALPVVLRRIAVSLCVVFHFVGILSTVFSVDPGPWLATMYRAYVSRPYLDFMYLNNAYHFYSPDPGPPNLLWFRIEYEDRSMRWYMMPHKDQFPTAINYQRRLSMTEYAHHAMVVHPEVLDRKQQLRWFVRDKYPLHPVVPDALEFSEPGPSAKRVIQNYARYVANHDLFGDAPSKVVRVRVYRLVHDILQAREIASREHPLDWYRFRPYYLGEFDAEGTLRTPNDPMLYWLVPIIKKDANPLWYPLDSSSLEKITRTDGSEYEIFDFLKVHAGNYR